MIKGNIKKIFVSSLASIALVSLNIPTAFAHGGGGHHGGVRLLI